MSICIPENWGYNWRYKFGYPQISPPKCGGIVPDPEVVVHMALTDTAIRNAKPKDKPYKLSDDGGLFVLVAVSGSKLWRLKYRYDGKENA